MQVSCSSRWLSLPLRIKHAIQAAHHARIPASDGPSRQSVEGRLVWTSVPTVNSKFPSTFRLATRSKSTAQSAVALSSKRRCRAVRQAAMHMCINKWRAQVSLQHSVERTHPVSCITLMRRLSSWAVAWVVNSVKYTLACSSMVPSTKFASPRSRGPFNTMRTTPSPVHRFTDMARRRIAGSAVRRSFHEGSRNMALMNRVPLDSWAITRTASSNTMCTSLSKSNQLPTAPPRTSCCVAMPFLSLQL
mmetsp:Transcript_14718/g.40606  ORF Transcript_14718/g.40606 Transcript_14718/m.40606 type:complete len:247 (-) Transcript_14718:202-942(-)